MKLQNFKYIFLAWDLPLSIALGVLLYYLLPEPLPNAFAKDIYGVAISILSIIFPLYFAALTVIMSSSDDSFVVFLEEKNRYTTIISVFNFSLLCLFTALVCSIFMYVNTSILIIRGFPGQHKILFALFTFTFSYGLCATLTATLDSIRYGLTRARFLRKKNGIDKSDKANINETN